MIASAQIVVPEEDTQIAPKHSHAILLIASQVVRWSFRLIYVLVLSRVLGPKELGVYALIYAVAELVLAASGAGYTDYLTRDAAKDARAGWGLATQLIGLRIAIAIPSGFLAIGVLSLMGYPNRVLEGTAWMVLSIIPRSLGEAVQGVLRGIHRYASYIAIELILGGTLFIGAAVIVVLHGQLRMAITVEVLAATASGLGGLVFALKYRTRERIRVSVSQLVKKSAVFNIYGFIANLYDRADVVMLSKLAGNYATGIYSVAYRGLIMTQVVGYGVLYSLLPTLSGKYSSRPN